ncbi:type II toxin-antitoxin system RelE/ParE family toxin [Bergeriella denitrificans]|uniref:Addiction module toxin, RelE/StbE family n=1 Tax=Bergeriella denitrificans TaxID=494 RepID=A0A378UHV7_BERDE|nr:type II toxin-antitoxin system RelE/ParE family toxin [Bergeriella denitrificans]STZ76964.1 addiction module toxin, RelE/StbE family [Bergeriella denitrificans]
MTLLLEWTAPALDDVDEIIDFIFNDNPTAAFEMEQFIQESTANLTVLPYIGRRGRVEQTHEWIIHPNYLIVYEINASHITIMRVLHTRQCYP